MRDIVDMAAVAVVDARRAQGPGPQAPAAGRPWEASEPLAEPAPVA